MKKVLLLMALGLILTYCSSKKAAAEKVGEPVVQYRDDFKSVSDKKKVEFLNQLNAQNKTASVIILTKGYKGEDVSISNEKKQLYNGNPITNLGTGIAGYIKIDNTSNTKIVDKFSKKEAVIDSENAKKYKFIYIMQDYTLSNPFKITYSNTLRPLK
ncbi:hypothetical protein LZZ90_00770 [Flavobacterium sp. SM15]|uniref:hypothetical protein n=1 Tax=Flavobacterium sp. SM15 TaxID=2908005 RepID=UPI001EDB3BA2|nr:hypothetical protein [Flavobacterium sp. SM15]MCG2610035.1 hypothetical protein [Flavobacterium sp. SM15]